MEVPKAFLPPGGGYEGLAAYKKATVMMGKLIDRLEKDIVAKGGIRERMAVA